MSESRDVVVGVVADTHGLLRPELQISCNKQQNQGLEILEALRERASKLV